MSRRRSNGHSPLVNQHSQITSFFSKTTSSPSPISSKSKQTQNPNPSPTTPSPLQSKPKPKPKKSHGQEVVGKRIRVYWPLDKIWYEGYVKLFSKDNGKHLVQYDDAEEEWLDLEKERIEWVQETVKTLKRLSRGPLSTSSDVVMDGDVVMEDEDKEGSNDVADDDSSDEDWGKSGDKDLVAEVGEEEEELMELEDEEDDEVSRKSTNKGKRGSRSKRKLKGGGSLGSAKKTKCDKDVMEPTPNAETKYRDFECTKAANGMNTVFSGDASARFIFRGAEKLHFLGE